MKAYLLLVLTFLFVYVVPAQDAPVERKLQPQDIVKIAVFNQPQINADVPISQEGYLTAPFLGAIRVEGMTPGELEIALAEEYVKKLRLRDPIVSVTVLRFRPLFATVGGHVQRPGTYEIRPGESLLSLLNQGGGPIPDRADLRRATLRRNKSAELIPIDLYALLIQGDTSQNFELQDGDELVVPEETRNRILVLGAVQNPGVYPYKEPMTLADAIALGRGPIPHRSRFSKVVITRQKNGQPGEYQQIVADFVRFQRNGDQTQNVVLQPGDMVFVPETNTPDLARIGSLLNFGFLMDAVGFRVFRR
jgi:polysaccharide biosynthesis/export protein